MWLGLGLGEGLTDVHRMQVRRSKSRRKVSVVDGMSVR